ncbi:DUF938 domain-containing protein [Pseudanabaena sp. Chao 1811]|uniref:DUF938 domain-containing protein n=1 Tax=Pseudanabaena sp. Chao 1811 TaxID=2963092 RepID=UPI0031F67EB8
MEAMQDARQYAPATARNRDAILEVLSQILPTTGSILEISSGTGEHAVYFSPHLQPRQWIPSDPNPIAIASITAWQQHQPSPNLVAPLTIDVTEPDWSDRHQLQDQNIQAIVNINMIHIAPWTACLGLMSGANRILPEGGILYLYGAYKQNGKHTSPSNAEFDASLRYQNPEWGVRNLEEVIAVAAEQNLTLQKVHPMPSNNLSVVFQKTIAIAT